MRRDLVDFGLPLRDTAGLLGRGRGAPRAGMPGRSGIRGHRGGAVGY